MTDRYEIRINRSRERVVGYEIRIKGYYAVFKNDELEKEFETMTLAKFWIQRDIKRSKKRARWHEKHGAAGDVVATAGRPRK